MGISLFNALSGAANATANAAGGNQAGIAAGNEINQNNLLQQIQLARQSAQDQLNRQSTQSRIALEGAQGDEARARASAAVQPPLRASVTVGPNQQAVDPVTGRVLASGPTREDPAVAAAARTAASNEAIAARATAAQAAQADRQDKQIAATGKQQNLAATAREYTDANTGYQQVEAKKPTQTHPILSHVPFIGSSMQTDYTENENAATARLKAAWQAYKDAGGNPPDIPSAGLVSDKYAATPKAKP